MLKIIENTGYVAKPKKTEVWVASNSILDCSEVTNQKNSTKRKNQAKITKSKNLVKSKNHDFFLNSRNIEVKLSNFTLEARLTFIKLRQLFVKALILHYF